MLRRRPSRTLDQSRNALIYRYAFNVVLFARTPGNLARTMRVPTNKVEVRCFRPRRSQDRS